MESIILILVGIVAAIITYLLNTKFNLGAIRASALPTLIVSTFLYLFPQLLSNYLNINIPIVFIGCSFIGMVTSQQLSTYTGLALASIIFTTLYLNTSAFFNGYGGALGTSACISLLVVLCIPQLKNKRKLTIGLLQFRKFILKGKRR
jgi:tetrahydromethanopterin S-methyltransferase subunit C